MINPIVGFLLSTESNQRNSFIIKQGLRSTTSKLIDFQPPVPPKNDSGSKWSLKRRFGLGCNARQVSALARLPVHQSRVLRYTVVPDDHGTWLPLDSGLEVGAVGNVVVEEFQEVI